MQGRTVTETKRQLARLRAALDRLGAETEGTRSQDADTAYYDCFGPLEALEREAGAERTSTPENVTLRFGTSKYGAEKAARELLECLDLADHTWGHEDERAPEDLGDKWNALRAAVDAEPQAAAADLDDLKLAFQQCRNSTNISALVKSVAQAIADTRAAGRAEVRDLVVVEKRDAPKRPNTAPKVYWLGYRDALDAILAKLPKAT